ncbi:hypothetical protein K435DRAFT_829530 [Dendrothele bispora CBS 962.96]|uniref:Uncharacterized protein n=1 Tax=Dendrothele bispora (strain CBS 962.96) TaxID=1314807 RepID=A0A4S8LUL0_DENBC|nr:hypothetical protein K435DRAFT_829530 [Dendrothele bispora CBS 962.96]
MGALSLLESLQNGEDSQHNVELPEYDTGSSSPPLPDFFNLRDLANPLRRSERDEAIGNMANSMKALLLTRLEEVSEIGSDADENEEDYPDEDDQDEEFFDCSEGPRKRARNTDSTPIDPAWVPWKDCITCTLDVLMHLPRSVFSEKQLDLLLWLLSINGISDVPSVKSMKTLNEKLQKLYGVNSIRREGALGHVYYVNDLSQMIAQEMANPQVRPHLHFYPEDTGKRLSEARQAKRWLEEIPDDLLTPMARIHDQDFFIYEPVMLQDSTCCIPTRWFERAGSLWAKCWRMQVVVSDQGVQGWNVFKSDDFEVCTSGFLKNFPNFRDDAHLYGIPSPEKLLIHLDIYDALDPTQPPARWEHTNPTEGNRWRKLAAGHRVVSFAIWMYCDDTSGNMSKKWNKHNSFLFTPAGLPRSESHKEYNVHFLCTSNIAPPLEMLDGIVEQLELAEENGIWAWDCELNEPVLVLPFVLALLGDNPMQSEFAAHIGLRGKYFCRVCWVKGADAKDREAIPGEDSTDARDDDADVDQGKGKSKPKKKNKFSESFEQMLGRITSFIKPNTPRNKHETQDTLKSYLTEAKQLYTKTKIRNLRTETGVKDTYQDSFLDKLLNASGRKGSKTTKQSSLDEVIKTLPDDLKTTSPVWRIKGLDPHRDTPVEILHVVLLGFLKYMWRDLVQNQLKKNDARRSLLLARLKSVDVTGLGISSITEDTLVQYAGSLTGRDFRVIAQVVPGIIHDLKLSDDCRETWLALCKLVPLVWQPEITDIDEHIRILDHEIEHFLLCASRWTCRWFNKPKFHIFVHLPFHIRRFGPAILFATEAFESFNAVIRAKSVHSNRQAPSRDIAHAFAQGNRIRHTLSNGLFALSQEPSEHHETQPHSRKNRTAVMQFSSSAPSFSFKREDWTSVGMGVRSMLAYPSTVTRYLVYAHVIIRDIPSHATYVARAIEILQEVRSVATFSGQASSILVQVADVSNEAVAYRMPRIQYTNVYKLVEAKNIVCIVNAQHHCVGNGCKATASRTIRQEREETTKTYALIAHNNPDDCFLNTAQMRNAIHLQKFRIESPSLPAEQIISQSVRREIDIMKKVKRTAETAENISNEEILSGIRSEAPQEYQGQPL